jgi:16S rRNA (cytidine1402-2'-O)-methyltransferase
MGTLYLVATPIGNLEDITLRALRILRETPLVVSEDTRHTRKLLSHYQIRTRQISFHEHSPPARLHALLNALDRHDVALVTDAGTPSLSDPGYALVRAAWERGHTVRPVPGPSATVAALSASGLPVEGFQFVGYLPRRAAERRQALEALSSFAGSLVIFEVPHRLRATLADLESVLGGERPAASCRELTKIHEEIFRGSLTELRNRFDKDEPKGEFTLVVGGAAGSLWSAPAVRGALRERIAAGVSPSQAARQVSDLSGWRRNDVYRMALEDS